MALLVMIVGWLLSMTGIVGALLWTAWQIERPDYRSHTAEGVIRGVREQATLARRLTNQICESSDRS
jgi:hypothetical protein